MKVNKYVGAFAVILFIISFSTITLFTDYTTAMKNLDSPEAMMHTEQVLSYFTFQNELPTVFNEEEQSHMQDVRFVFLIFVLLFMISIIAFILTDNKSEALIRGPPALLIVVLLAALIPFRILFNLIHFVLFPQGNWTFPMNSILLEYYPLTFFSTYAQIFLFQILMLSIVLMVVGYLIKKE